MVRVTAILRLPVPRMVLVAVLAATTLTATLLVSPAAMAASSNRTGSDARPANGAASPGPSSATPSATTPAAGCLKPGVPMCMDDTTTFVSADSMSSCQFEVKEYVERSMEYLKCLNDENVTTGQELTRNIDRFNCRLSGRKGCN